MDRNYDRYAKMWKFIINIFWQRRALYCYLVLSLWIFVIVIGVYRYLGTHNSSTSHHVPRLVNDDAIDTQALKNNNLWFSDSRFKKVHKSCYPTNLIEAGSESMVYDNYTLEGIAVVFRHGDRGPMNHVRNLNAITCGYSDDSNVTELYSKYATFMSNNWSNSNQGYSSLFQFIGQPNNHPSMPVSKQCDIGQLSLQGVMQHLKLGSILRTLYFDKLFADSTQVHTNIIAYTTKYRRTFQSLNAFLFGFLKSEGFLKIPLNTVTSMSYCFEDCACPAKELYLKTAIAENSKRIRSKSDVLKMVEEVSSVVYTFSDSSFVRDPYYLKDALMAYLCHNTHLPCLTNKCVYPQQALKVFSYVDWDSRQLGKSVPRQKYCILSAYGFIKNIVSHLLKIVSNEKPKVVLYSAHDKTIQFILTALGITTNEAVFPPYASRVIFEIYARKEKDLSTPKKFYFRLIFNGKDHTQRIKFCTTKNRISFVNDQLKTFLCSFESLIRFLHDDYFSAFNSTNFKDACIFSKD